MRLLLDTHALLWWLSDDAELGQYVRDLIADPANDVLVSVVSLWEIQVKVRVGKLTADLPAILTRSRHRRSSWFPSARRTCYALAPCPCTIEIRSIIY
ncbi:MAG: type II toxin-antitoxin system VapC family toxin [Rhodospirillales bacterium]